MQTKDMILRILLAMLIGGLIGWERESTHRPAGLRTHMLVCVGSAIVMITGIICFGEFGNDPSRLGAQVISGIGFLGAGTIMREGYSVKGLTTAASLWVVACLGLAAGTGAYKVAIFGTVAIMITLTIFEQVECNMAKNKNLRLSISLTCNDASKALVSINETMCKFDLMFKDLNISTETAEGDEQEYLITFKIDSSKCRKKINYDDLTSFFVSIAEVSKINIQEY